MKEKNGNQCPAFENVAGVADAASVSTYLCMQAVVNGHHEGSQGAKSLSKAQNREKHR